MKGDLHNTRNLRGATVVLLWCYCGATVVLLRCPLEPKILAKSEIGGQSTGVGAVELSCAAVQNRRRLHNNI